MPALSLIVSLLLAGAPLDDVDLRELRGAWRADDGPVVLHVDGERLVELLDGMQTVSGLGVDGAWLVSRPFGPQPERRWQVTRAGDRLTLTDADGLAQAFTRLDEVPERARIAPLVFGARDPDAAERDALVEQLDERTRVDQEVRERLQRIARELGPEAFATPQPPALAEALGDMLLVDRDNTDWLLARVRDVGWIDVERFGSEAHQDAFLLVQHSGDLRLMQAALPLIERAIAGDPASGQSFALLSDRTRLALGQTQLYGSQLWGRDDAPGYVVPRLEDPDGVDARRAALGMPPLEQYLDLFRAMGDEVVIEHADGTAEADPAG